MEAAGAMSALVAYGRESASVGRYVALAMLTILAGGCASEAPVYVYSKPGITLEQMSRDEAECGQGARAGPARLRECMTERGYASQELRQGSYLELRDMPTPVQTP
jgi:hypothetical protein